MMLEWLTNYLLHSTVLLLLAGVSALLPRLARAECQDLIWKTALLAGLITASWQTWSPAGSPIRIATPDDAALFVPQSKPAQANVADPTAGLAKPVKPPATGLATAHSPDREAFSASIDWRTLALRAWLLGALALLADLALGALRLRQQLADRRRLPHDLLRRRIGDAAAKLRWSASTALHAPIAYGRREIVVPEHFARLPADQQQAALAHEAGHLQRRDPLWRLLGKIVECALFIQPGNRLINWRLAQLAELLSDSSAIRIGGAPASLAQSLLHFATLSRRPIKPALASPIIRSRHGLVARVQRLLKEPDMIHARSRGAAFALALAAVLGGGLLPGVSDGRRAETSKSWSGTLVDVDDRTSRMQVRHQNIGLRIEIDAVGKVEFSDAEDAVISLSDGGHFELEVERDGVERRYLAKSDGSLTHRFFVDGDEAPFDNQARAWLAQVLPEVMRMTGVNAEARVARLLEQGGPQDVIDEIEQIESDLVARIYVTQLARQQLLSADDLGRALAAIERQIGSDLESRLALQALMETQVFDRERWAALLSSAQTIGSDLELRLVLTAAAERMESDPVLVELYTTSVATIGSDLEKRLAIQALRPHIDTADNAALSALIAATGDIGSDLEQRLTLSGLAINLHDERAANAWLDAARTIGSDLEARLAYRDFLEARPPVTAVVTMIEAAADSIGSDLELRLLLDQALDSYGEDDAVRDAVIDASEQIGSSFERDRLLSRLMR